MQVNTENPVYEMLWDCKHCGAKKLLGLTHRYCPECGSPQNAEFRYFPAESEKVAVKDHIYFGADIVCRYCGTYNGKNAKHCKDCGGPLAEGSNAATRQDQVHAIGQYAGENIQHAVQERNPGAKPAPPKKKPSVLPVLIGAGILAVIAFALILAFWKREATFTVENQHWQREIDVERFGPVKQSAWCNEVPNDASGVRRYRAVRSYEQVQVGEDCQMRKVDRGDGTFSEQQECKPRYEKKPVEDDKCDFTVDRWSVGRTLTAKGAAVTPEPNWPPVTLTKPGCAGLGCEREGARRETYTVVFKNAEDGESGDCTFDQLKWQSFAPGTSLKGQVGVIGGWLDCGSLTK
jgi:hypothetical protein